MKILYLHRTQARGAEGNHIRGIVDAMRRAGHEVDVLGPPGVVLEEESVIKNKQGKEPGILSRLAVSLPQIVFEVLELGYNIYAFCCLWRKLNGSRYDFIYERYSLFGVAGVLTGKIFNVPVLLEVNDATVIERSRPLLLKSIAKKLELLSLYKCNGIITISKKFKNLLVSNYKIYKRKILVTPNAINASRFKNFKKDMVTRELLNISSPWVIATTGAFLPWHGLDFLLNASAKLIQAGKLHLLFVGDGPVRKDVESMAAILGVDDKVTFTGFLPSSTVPMYLDLADICVIPDSNIHCSPVKLFEYMAVGKPIIAPSYEPITEVLSNEENALIFTPRDADGLKYCIQRIMDDKNLSNRLGQEAKAKVFRFHTWDHNVEKILQMQRDYSHTKGLA